MADDPGKEPLDSNTNDQPNPSGEIIPSEETEPITPIQQTENMEVHKHPHHVTHKKKWAEYLFEFFMMFFAVFLGFIAENIRENYLEHKKAAEYALFLKHDLINDTLQLNSLIEGKDTIGKLMTSAAILYEKPVNEITVGDLRKNDSSEVLMDFFTPHDVTIELLKNSGNLRYFNDPDLILELGIYEWMIKRYNDLRNQIMQAYGGITSREMLQYDIQLNKFHQLSSNINSNILAKQAGYNFQMWDEHWKVIQNILEFMKWWDESTYPDIKNRATMIINLLNKKYNLK